MFLTKTKEVQLYHTQIVKSVLKRANVRFKYLNAAEFSQNTPLDEWIHSDKLAKSKFLVSHTSDVLRYLTLWKFGGTYLDLDVIVVKSFSASNYACQQSEEDMNCAILSLDKNRGREISSLCIE